MQFGVHFLGGEVSSKAGAPSSGNWALFCLVRRRRRYRWIESRSVEKSLSCAIHVRRYLQINDKSLRWYAVVRHLGLSVVQYCCVEGQGYHQRHHPQKPRSPLAITSSSMLFALNGFFFPRLSWLFDVFCVNPLEARFGRSPRRFRTW